jgi:hypothetical protein
MSLQIRLARDGVDSAQVEALVRTGRIRINGVSFEKLYPFWIVVEEDEEIVGCVQAVPALPFGYTEFLTTAPGLSHTKRAKLIKGLMLQTGGSEIALGTVPTDMKAWKKVIKKRGGVNIGLCNVYAKRLT